MYRLSQVARKLNVGRTTIIDFLSDKGFEVDSSPNSKITEEQFDMLSKEFADSAQEKEEASGLTIGSSHSDNLVIKTTPDGQVKENKDEERILIKDNVAAPIAEAPAEPETPSEPTEEPQKPAAEEKTEEPADERVQLESEKLSGPKVVGKIDLDSIGKPKKKEEPVQEEKKAEETPEPAPVEEVKEEVVETPEAKKEAPKAEEPAKEEEAPKAEEAAKEVKEEKAEEPAKKEEEKPQEVVKAKADSLKGLTVLGKIE